MKQLLCGLTAASVLFTVPSGSVGAEAKDTWHRSPFLEFGPLQGEAKRAVSFHYAIGKTAPVGQASTATDADYTSNAAAVALLLQPSMQDRFVFRLGLRETAVEYNDILQDRTITGLGLGVDYYHLFQDIVINAGISFSAARFDNTVEGGGMTINDDWHGRDFEIHATLNGPIIVQEKTRMDYFIGGQALWLVQDAHDLEIIALDREVRTSQTLMAGIEFEGTYYEPGGRPVPWAFAGVVHEFDDRPPQRPSLLASGPALSNAFTLFSDQLNGVPNDYPDPTTIVFGVGINGDPGNGAFLDLGLYHEINPDFSATILRMGLAFHL